MIAGIVTAGGDPIVELVVAGQTWTALVDTGFNGDLQLPDRLRPFVNARYVNTIRSLLADGQVVVEDNYAVDFPFDGQTVSVEATFVSEDLILLGTRLMRPYRLTVDFVDQTVLLERGSP